MTTIIIFLIVLSVLVLVHELGHFAVAKWSGMKVEEFGFGFPPRLFAIKKGETEYSVNAIPLGGFVKIFGENGEDRLMPGAFASKPIWKRFLVLIAGVTMNILLAWVLLSAGFMAGLPSQLDNQDFKGAEISDANTQIMFVLPESPAEKAGLKIGDNILSVEGTSVVDATKAKELIGLAKIDQEITIVVDRSGAQREIKVAPQEIEEGVIAIGTQISTVGTVKYPPHLALIHGAESTALITRDTAKGFIGLISKVFHGGGMPAEVSGPVGIATLTGEVAQMGIVYLIYFMAILSINLAILNVLPFPALDGGRIVFLAYELFTKRPASAKVEGIVHGLGFLLLMLLVIVVTYKDIINIL